MVIIGDTVSQLNIVWPWLSLLISAGFYCRQTRDANSCAAVNGEGMVGAGGGGGTYLSVQVERNAYV